MMRDALSKGGPQMTDLIKPTFGQWLKAQGWGMFRIMLAYKLEERGGHLLTVDPKYTSRTCSACGLVDADSREGTRFSCRSCGHQAHADTNAAINILRRGSPSMPAEDASAPGETGTSEGAQQWALTQTATAAAAGSCSGSYT